MAMSSQPLVRSLCLVVAACLAITQAAAQAVNFCRTYNHVCNDFLDQICPTPLRHMVFACNTVTSDARAKKAGCFDLKSFNPTCACGTYDGTSRIAEIVNDAIVQTNGSVADLLVLNTDNSVDVCDSYVAVCNKLLNTIGCCAASRTVGGCSTPGDLSTFTAGCKCGELDMSDREGELIIDALVKKDVARLEAFTQLRRR